MQQHAHAGSAGDAWGILECAEQCWSHETFFFLFFFLLLPILSVCFRPLFVPLERILASLHKNNLQRAAVWRESSARVQRPWQLRRSSLAVGAESGCVGDNSG